MLYRDVDLLLLRWLAWLKADAFLHCRDDLPKFEPVDLTVDVLLQEGRRLADEQQQVLNFKLSEDYMKKTGSGPSLIGLSG